MKEGLDITFFGQVWYTFCTCEISFGFGVETKLILKNLKPKCAIRRNYIDQPGGEYNP